MADSFWGRSTSVAARLMAAVGVVGVCIVGAPGTVGTALAQEARDWQGDAIGRGIAGLERLGRTLGLDGFGGDVGEVMPGSGQSIIAALCRIAVGEGGEGEACVEDLGGTEELIDRVLKGQAVLAEAAETASKLHEEAQGALVAELFEGTVCRSAPTSPCDDREGAREWWQEHGARALMVLDRIGREHIKLSERQADAEVDNARAHVHARLEAALVREEVKMVVRALVAEDRGRFRALSEVGEDRSAELTAVAAVPSWVQQKVSARLARRMGCGEGNDALLARLCEALAQGDESRTVSDRLQAAFSEDLQRMREIVAFGDAVGAREQCALPDAIASQQPVDATSLRAAVENIAAFADRCNADAPDIGGGLADALWRAEAAAPSKIELAQALCEVGVATSQGPAAALGEAFREGLAPVLATLADGSSPNVCSAVATLPSRRDLSDEEFRTRIDAADDEDADGLRGTKDVISRIGEDAVEALRGRLRELAPRLLALGRLLFDADGRFQRVPVVPALGGCDEPGADMEVELVPIWRLGQPLVRWEAGRLAVDLAADLAFCLPSRTAGVDGVEVARRVWPFARAADRVTVRFNDLLATGNGAADGNRDAAEGELLTLLREGGVDSLRVDDEALRTYAVASAVGDDERTGDAVDEAIRKRLAAIFLQLVPSGTLGEWLDLDSLTHAFTEDGRGLVFRVPIGVGRTSTQVCVVAQLDAAQPTIPEGCNEPRGLNRTFWEVLERRVTTEAVATLWDRAEEELESLVEEVPRLERVVDVLVGQARTADADRSIRATISTERTVLELRMPAAVEALELDPHTPVRAVDLTGQLSLVVDFATGDIAVDAIPEIDLRSVAERFYGALGGPRTGVPALSVTTLSADETDVCSGGSGLRLAFDRRWPVGGQIGALCWSREDWRFDFVAPRTGVDITIAAANLKLLVNSGDITLEHEEAGDSLLRILAGVNVAGVDDPWGLRESPMELLVEFNLATGALTVPPEQEQNDDFYAHIRRRAQAMLPLGAWIERVEFSTNGIDLVIGGLSTAAPEGGGTKVAFHRLFQRDRIRELAALGLMPDPRGAGCHVTRAALVGRMLRDLEMPSEEEQERLRSLCGSDREDLEVTEGGELRLHADGPTVLTWNCRTSVGGGRGLRQCTVTSSQLGRACRVVRADSGGSLATRMVNAGGCLADALTPLVPLELREFSIGRDVSLRFRCPDPLELHECGIDVIANVGLDGIVGRLATLTANTDCEGPIPQSSIEIEFRLGLDGALRPRSEVQEGLREVARHVGDRLGCVVQERLAESGGIVDDSLTAAVDWLADVREKIESALGAARASFDCSAVLRERYRGSLEVPCDYYLDEDIAGHAILLRTPPQALVFRREIQLFEQTIHIEFVLAFGADVPALRVRCPSCGDRLDDLADSVARILAGMSADTLRYDGGATLHLVEEELRLRAPFEMELTFLDTSFSVVVTCSLDAREGDVFCDGQEPATLLSAAVVAAISRKIEDSGGRIAIPFGPFGAAVTEADSAGARIELSGDVSFPGVDEAVDLTVTLPLFGHAFDLEWDPNQLLGDLEEALLERVNGLFGSFVPIEITALDLVYDDVWPTGVRLSGAASIAELFTVSVPDVLLTDEGLSVDGPRELTIGFPAGLQLPVPPFTVCPTGGSLGPDRLVVVASVTVADCSADALLAVRGRGEVRLDTPGVFGVRGNLLLLRFLSLGNATAELNLPGRFLETELDIGGAIADVVRFRADMRVDGGDAPLGRARGELYLFRVPLSEQSVHVDLSRGGVEAEVGFDLFGVIVANGKFRMETFGRNPELGAKGAARVLGFTLASLGLQARPNYAKAGFRVLGLGLSVVVPGLDTLSPATLLEMIKNLLTPNFENLDEALLALLKGQIDLNPLADFGPGGDSALDGGDGDGDGAEGESPIDEGLGADDAAPGAVGEGDQSVAPAPSNAEEPTLLNPPGRFHIVIEPAGDDAWTIDLMEGDKHDTMIARVPGHLLTRPILRDGAGRPLVFNRHAYAHLADGRIAENATAVSGCQAGEVVPTVFTFVGIEAPRVGYFELCRLKTDDGSPVTPEALSDTAHGDLLRPFLTGLAAFPDSMPALWAQGEDSASNRPSRVLLSGWIGKIADDIRVAAGLAAPGRLLLVAEMPGAPDGATCTVTPDHSAAPSIRAFVLDAPDFSAPLDAAEVGKLEHVLRGLAACTGGSAALTRVSDEEQYLSAAGYLSRWSAGENGFVLVREPNELDEPVHTPAAPMELALLEALRADAPPLELVGSPPPSLEEIEEIAERSGTPEQRLALLDGGDSGTWIEIASEAGECVVRYAGAQRGRITGFPAGVFGGDCAPDGTVLGVGYADDTGDAGNPGRLMLVEMAQDRQAASLVHVGWGQAQRVELGAGWRTRQAFSVYRRAFRESLGSEPLALVETVKGFEEADGGAAWLYFASMEGDSPGWLIWAGRVGQGKLRLPAGIDDQQVNDLPRLIEVLATDAALPEAGEYGVAEWLVTGGHGLMLRTWEEYRMVPVVMWRASGNPGLLPGWQLAARLFERPAMRPGTSRDAARGMLDERLAGDPSAPTRAVWMFQYGEAMGLAFRGEGGPDEILWRYQQTEHGQSTAVQRVPQLLERAELDRLGAVDNWTFEGAANQEVLITAASGDFDTVVELWSPAGTFVACDDDSGESLNSQLKTRLPVAGRYDLLVYAYEDRHKGFYDVEVRGVEEAFTESGDDQCSRRGPGRGVEMLQEAFAQRSARVNGFFGLHTADACDGPASALVDRLQGGADPDNWVVRLESAECATGEVFLVEVTADGYDADSIRTVERFQGDAFALVSDIVGAPLPRNLFAAFRAEFLGDDVVQPLHLEGISVPLDDLGLGLAPAWAARMPRSDELVVLLMAGGDARRVIIHGVDDGSDSLAKLISFAVASPGDEFRARSVSNGGVMVEVRTTSGDHWLVVFDQDFEATHWVGVEGAALSGDRRRVDALALVLEAVSQLDGPAFRYDDGRGTPPRWDVAADDAALAVRPLTGGPYLLFGPVDDAEGWGTTVLCGAALPESLLLDLARRTGSHFGSSDANAATLAARLQGKVCSGAKPEVARFQPAPDSHDAGLLTSVDGDGRLVVATFTSCADGGDQGRCTLSPQRSEPEVPPALAERLLAMIGSEVGVGAAELRLVHDDGRRNAEDRRLLFAWKRDDRERMLFGMERNERPEICVPGASWVTLGRGEGEAPTLDSREVVEGLLAFFESRGCRTAAPEIVVFLYGEDVVVVFEDGGLMPAAALGGARLDRGEMTGAAVRYETAGARNGTWLLTARGISHTPAAAAQFPLQVRASAVSQRQARRLAWMVADSAPRARDGLPNGYRSLGGRTTWARSADFAQAQTGAAPSDDSVRIRVSFIPNGGRAALDVPVSLLDDGRAEIIYRAMIPYLMQTKRTLEVVRVGNERDLYRSLYDNNLTLVVDTAGEQPRIALLAIADDSRENVADWVLRAAVRAAAEPPPYGELAPAQELVGADRHWLMADRPVGSVRRLSQEQDAELLGTLPQFDPLRREAILRRVAESPKPFCALAVGTRAWLHFNTDEVKCAGLGRDGARRAWLVWSQGRWLAIETALEPGRVPIDTAIGILPAMSEPDAVFVQVTAHDDGRRKLLALMATCQGYSRERRSHLRKIYRIAEETAVSLPLTADEELAACLPRRDFDVLLDDLATEDPPGGLHLLEAAVPARHGGERHLLPVLYRGADKTVSRLGFRGRLIDLHLVRLGDSPDTSQAAVVEAETGGAAVSELWREAYLAFAAAAPAGPENGAPNAEHVLVVPPTEGAERGWLIVSGRETVEISGNAERESDDASRSGLAVPPDALSARARRQLVARLVAGLHSRLGSPGEKWPHKIAASGQVPFLAEVSRGRWIAVAEGIPEVAEVVASDFDGDAAIEPEGLLRGSLRGAFGHDWGEERAAGWEVHRVRETEGAIFGKSERDWPDGPFVAAGYWNANRKVFVQMDVERKRVAASRAGDVVAALRHVTEGEPPSVTEREPPSLLRLYGRDASLRLCSDLTEMFRVIQARGPVDVPGRQFDLEIWQGGERRDCKDGTIVGWAYLDDEVIRVIDVPQIESRVALVVSSEKRDRNHVLVGRSEPGGERDKTTLARVDGDEEVSTGCRSLLEGRGAAMLAETLMEMRDLSCAHAMEYDGDSEVSPAGAAIAGRRGRLVLAREGCRLELEPHEASDLDAEEALIYLDDFWDGHASSMRCRDGKGSWLVHGDVPFAIAESRLWRVKTNWEMDLTGGVDSRREDWLARWMASPYVLPGELEHDAARVLGEAGTIGEYLGIKVGDWSSTRTGRAPTVVLDSSTCLATLMVPGELDEAGSRWLYEVYTKRRMGVSTLPQDVSLREFEEGGRSAEGEQPLQPYVCDGVVVDLAVGNSPRTGVAQIATKRTCFISWLAGFRDSLAGEEPTEMEECIRGIDFWDAENSTGSLLVNREGDAEGDLEKRGSFLYDLLRDNGDMTARSASGFLANLGGGWEIDSWDIEPRSGWDKYSYFIVDDSSNGTPRFRTNVIYDACLEIKDDEDLEVTLTNKGFAPPEACGSGSNGLCAVQQLYQRLSPPTDELRRTFYREGGRLRPLWYRSIVQLFEDDPREAIKSVSISCE